MVKQAAILCGGLGTRLLPITHTIPKPMVAIHNRPFLEYLLEQLKDNGIFDIVLMTGYLGDTIKNYFGDGHKWGLRLQYSYGPKEWDTGKRIYEARNLLEDHFLLLYSDNFVTFNLSKLIQYYSEKKTPLVLTLKAKEKGNISLKDNGMIDVYDKTRQAQNLNFVELGYMLVQKNQVLNYWNGGNMNFSSLMMSAVREGKASGIVCEDNYYSVSDPQRLEITRQYLKNKKILLIDRDGVINQKAPRGEYITNWEDFHFIPGTLEALQSLAQKGFSFIVVSNQAGIARGVVSRKKVEEINEKMKLKMNSLGIKILDIYLCPHHWDDDCLCRKPRPGMLIEASKKWLFRLDKTFFIGDDLRDCQAAYYAGCRSLFLGEKSQLDTLDKKMHPCGIIKYLNQAESFLDNTISSNDTWTQG